MSKKFKTQPPPPPRALFTTVYLCVETGSSTNLRVLIGLASKGKQIC